jgi:hypothetical protein
MNYHYRIPSSKRHRYKIQRIYFYDSVNNETFMSTGEQAKIKENKRKRTFQSMAWKKPRKLSTAGAYPDRSSDETRWIRSETRSMCSFIAAFTSSTTLYTSSISRFSDSDPMREGEMDNWDLREGRDRGRERKEELRRCKKSAWKTEERKETTNLERRDPLLSGKRLVLKSGTSDSEDYRLHSRPGPGSCFSWTK